MLKNTDTSPEACCQGAGVANSERLATMSSYDSAINLSAESAPKPPRSEVLLEAEGLITGDRNVSYGTPTQNFTNIAELWTTRLRHKLGTADVITATEVADLMILLKVARNIADTKRDTYVDIAGYAGCGWEASLSE